MPNAFSFNADKVAYIMKLIFAANHRWAVANGEERLRLELARRKNPIACQNRPNLSSVHSHHGCLACLA
jgi:hypothetical protein